MHWRLGSHKWLCSWAQPSFPRWCRVSSHWPCGLYSHSHPDLCSLPGIGDGPSPRLAVLAHEPSSFVSGSELGVMGYLFPLLQAQLWMGLDVQAFQCQLRLGSSQDAKYSLPLACHSAPAGQSPAAFTGPPYTLSASHITCLLGLLTTLGVPASNALRTVFPSVQLENISVQKRRQIKLPAHYRAQKLPP